MLACWRAGARAFMGVAPPFRGAGLDVVWRPLLALAAIGAALFGAAWLRFGVAMRAR